MSSANIADNCEQPTAYNISIPNDQMQDFCYRSSSDYSICNIGSRYVRDILTKSYEIPQSYNPKPLRFEVTFNCSGKLHLKIVRKYLLIFSNFSLSF